jgi:hypothetical protein
MKSPFEVGLRVSSLTSVGRARRTGIIVGFEEWAIGRWIECKEDRDYILDGWEDSSLCIKLDKPYTGRYSKRTGLYFWGDSRCWVILDDQTPKTKGCKHEYIPLFNSISCKHCGKIQ